MKNESDRLGLPQRYIDKRDITTKKTIEIIGRRKYMELLENNIVAVDYETIKQNQRAAREHVKRLKKSILFLSNLLNLKVHPHKADCPIHGIPFRTYRHHQRPKMG